MLLRSQNFFKIETPPVHYSSKLTDFQSVTPLIMLKIGMEWNSSGLKRNEKISLSGSKSCYFFLLTAESSTAYQCIYFCPGAAARREFRGRSNYNWLQTTVLHKNVLSILQIKLPQKGKGLCPSPANAIDFVFT